MLTVRLDNVFSSSPAADDKAPVVRLDEHILRTCPLDIVDDLPNWATLSRTKACMLALWYAGAFRLPAAV